MDEREEESPVEIPGQCGWDVVARPKQLMKLVQDRRWEAGVCGPGLSFHREGKPHRA